MYHDPHGEDAGSSKENRMIFTESMPRRVGSFYRGKSCCYTKCSARKKKKTHIKIRFTSMTNRVNKHKLAKFVVAFPATVQGYSLGGFLVVRLL